MSGAAREICLPPLRSAEDLTRLVGEIGFLPFFRNAIPGFSIEECTPPELWFSETRDGPWEWKGPAIRTGLCLYGKLFGRKAGYVSRAWAADFCCQRRDGFDMQTRWLEQRVPVQDKRVYDAIRADGAVETGPLKSKLGFGRGGGKGFDAIITRLQMQTDVCIGDFIYHLDRNFKPYGWGTSLYTTPEALFGVEDIAEASGREPEECGERILAHLKSILPDTDEAKLKRLLKG